MSKLITFAVPCYNSAAYMDHCVRTLLTGGDHIEIIPADDGPTKDHTPAICERHPAEYPAIDPANHQSLCKRCHDRKTALEQRKTGGFF